MPASTTYDLPISGMTCASCASRVERALRKVTGTEQVSVNLATEQARVQAPVNSLPALVEAIREAGYGVPTRTVELQIGGMTCASCVGRVERALGKLPGVERVSVNLASERAHLEVLAALDDNLLIDAVQRPATAPACRKPPRTTSTLPSTACVTNAWRSAQRCCSPCRWWYQWWCSHLACTGCCQRGCSSCWPHRCSSFSARGSTWPPGKPCAPGLATWTCW